MGLGILEDKHLEHVPGTTLFSDDPNAIAESVYAGLDLSSLKHAKGKNEGHIVLVPQPSDDPNDPLNWPTWKKHMVFFVLVYGTVVCGVLGPIVSADLVGIAAEFDRSVQAISRALGSALVLALAFATVVWSVSSIKFGKRPVFLLSSLMMFAGSMIASFTKNYNMLLGSRILQGVGEAVLEFLVGASIADIYFTHERGIPVALWNLALLNGINITPPITGQVIMKQGWRFAFKLFSIFCGVLFLFQFFLAPETTYHRIVPGLVPTAPNESESQKSSKENIDPEKAKTSATEHIISIPQKKSYLQELSVYNGIYPTKASVCNLLLRPFIACLTPVCLWASLLYGVAITWLVLIATSVAQLFSGPPYNFDTGNIGLTYMSPFIFSFLAALLCGPLTDYVAKRFSLANQGIFEPEFRLVLVVFYAVFGGMGFFGWGISADIHDPWIGPVIFFGLINFGITIGCSAAIGYVVDSHRQSADSALGGVILFSFIITLFINELSNPRGVLNVFGIVGGITLFTCFLTIPMYIYGKRARSWIHRTVKFDDDEVTAVAH
ncbi:MFS general substrate transporter [Fomitiporia mediterranea MF3/22]|uniref:MFS general substrate transporter n=1 Tax=Fomitiporia mediterranea (strain MF3/22) TaxID=694068 RepID=UPI000440940A|nr:MFS general substrate transporter [Fomitiporia mediterranea MF3/22]EJD04924.1 MFS general substrate transporter [Fomitiporia mediterranea MF3/22]